MAGGHVNAELLVQFARERGLDAFARFELAARKLPIALVRLAGRTLREQITAVGLHQHADGNFRDLARRAAGAGFGDRAHVVS
ncbi:MAG: hypothetical protein GAK41_00005 [Burkholderia gladioli]|nr:MAG: hypothetical protein GAK41_00005 [Burkholderia gladioli]